MREGTSRDRRPVPGLWLGRLLTAVVGLGLVGSAREACAQQKAREPATSAPRPRSEADSMLLGYFEDMCRPKPFTVRSGADFQAHQRALREKLLACAGLWPLPQRPPLDVHESKPVDHAW
ncbi:MAG: hypothetical protein WBF17_18115, partial [Phycisphaerae bacterium]